MRKKVKIVFLHSSRDILYTGGEGENHLETEGAEIRAPKPGCFSSEECRSKFGESFGTGHNAGESLAS